MIARALLLLGFLACATLDAPLALLAAYLMLWAAREALLLLIDEFGPRRLGPRPEKEG